MENWITQRWTFSIGVVLSAIESRFVLEFFLAQGNNSTALLGLCVSNCNLIRFRCYGLGQLRLVVPTHTRKLVTNPCNLFELSTIDKQHLFSNVGPKKRSVVSRWYMQWSATFFMRKYLFVNTVIVWGTPNKNVSFNRWGVKVKLWTLYNKFIFICDVPNILDCTTFNV